MNSKLHEQRLVAVLVKKEIININYEIDEKFFHLKHITTLDIVKGIDENPRLLAPAIVLLVHYPRIINQFALLPEDIVETVVQLRKGNKQGSDCRYEKYSKLFQLCQFSSDKRVKGVNKKVRKNYRLDPEIEAKLQKLLETGKFLNETEIIEKAIESFASEEASP